MPVQFFTEEIEFQLKGKRKIQQWIKDVVREYDKEVGQINFIFCNDEYLLNINKQYLKHDYYTDIITFNQSEDSVTIDADIFISLERVTENSGKADDFDKELKRVIIHGILHLLGYEDHDEKERMKMRRKEEECLSLYEEIK